MPWLRLSTWACLTSPKRSHSARTSSSMSSHQLASVSASGSNRLRSMMHSVGMGEPAPSTPCAAGAAARRGCPAGAAPGAAGRPVLGSMAVAAGTAAAPPSLPARRCMSAARDAESSLSPTSPPSSSSSGRLSSAAAAPSCCTSAAAAAAPGGATETRTLCPARSRPSSCCMAAMPSGPAAKVTKPHGGPPGTAAISTDATAPKGSNSARTSPSRTCAGSPSALSRTGPAPACIAPPTPPSPGAAAAAAAACFCCCCASHATFFSASERFTITVWPRRLWPVSPTAASTPARSSNSTYAMPLLLGALRS
mmetsp:Transcript_18516/g.63099  ORF Transcript_18516/g.63099 Transcript_18516/m.63099 type:complete len:309 (+) Transcript_18516:1637-2563(+)